MQLSSRPQVKAFGARRPIPARTAPRCSAAASPEQFLEDLHAANLGKMRFILIGDAILEATSTFSKPRYTDLKEKGRLATIATETKDFECHMYLSKIKKVMMTQSKAKHGDWQMYSTRLVGEGDKVLLSMLLQRGPDGEYPPAVLGAWVALKSKYAASGSDAIVFEDGAQPAASTAEQRELVTAAAAAERQ